MKDEGTRTRRVPDIVKSSKRQEAVKYIVMIGDKVLCRTNDGVEAVRCCSKHSGADIYARFTRRE